MQSKKQSNDNTEDENKGNTTSSDKSVNSSDNLDKLMEKNYSYPDPQIQYKYTKREFYYIPPRSDTIDYNDIKEYRDNICSRDSTSNEHQARLNNFINPDTPYKNIIIFHGLGTGMKVSGV